MQNSGLSLMPQGLEKSIPPSDMCDLIEFISKLGSSHDAAMNSQVKPSSQTIKVDAEGTTRLPQRIAKSMAQTCVSKSSTGTLGSE